LSSTGSIVRIAPNWFSISDPDAIKLLYGHGTQLSKSEWYSGQDFSPDPTTNLFTERDPEKHGEKRRKVAQLYAMSSLISYEPYVDQCIDLLLSHFDSIVSRGSEINLRHWLQCYAFDVVSAITVSASHALFYASL
jgi:cytochrome P450